MSEISRQSGDAACSMRGLAGHFELGTTSARGLLTWFAGSGVRRVVLDAIHPELRPRNLGRSARRDLASTLKRTGLVLAGVDVFVPSAHLADPAHAERAASAIIGAIELVRDLESLGSGRDGVVCCRLPDELPGEIGQALVNSAEACGVILTSVRGSFEGVRRSVDLQALSDADVDSVAAVAGAGLAQVRWGGPKADTRLDLASIRAAMLVHQPTPIFVVDLSGAADASASLVPALRAWAAADVLGGAG